MRGVKANEGRGSSESAGATVSKLFAVAKEEDGSARKLVPEAMHELDDAIVWDEV